MGPATFYEVSHERGEGWQERLHMYARIQDMVKIKHTYMYIPYYTSVRSYEHQKSQCNVYIKFGELKQIPP